MLRSLLAFASFVATAAPCIAHANDSEAILAGGVLTLKKSEGITMESEELTIAPYRVDVAYVFRNTTAADISTRVAFPMAPYTGYEGLQTFDDLETEEERQKFVHAMGGFTVTVDGKPVTFETAIELKKAKNATESMEVTHHWLQTFPAGKAISVKHTFTPAGGFIYDDDERLWRDIARDYCVGPVLIKAMKRREGSINQVHYVLKTGANWKGPIGRFVLRIKKDKPSHKSSVCMDGFRKVDARTFVLEKTNFVPTHDLKVAFIRYD